MRGGSINQLLIITAILLIGCEPKPQPIALGHESCSYCRMMISDQEFGSQILNKQGRAIMFDSVECMAAFDVKDDGENLHSKWVPDFLDPEQWIRADEAVYLQSETLRSPMGLYLTAHATREKADEIRQEYGGELLSYNQVRQLVQREWLNEHNHQSHHTP